MNLPNAYVRHVFEFLDSQPSCCRTYKSYEDHVCSYTYVHAAMVGGVMPCAVYTSRFTFWILPLACTFSTVVLLDIKC